MRKRFLLPTLSLLLSQAVQAGPKPLPPLPPPDTGLNRSAWKVSGNPTAVGSNPEAAIDGKPETSWTTGQSQKGDEFFRIDLGEKKKFSRIAFDAGNTPDTPRAYIVYASNDKDAWGGIIAASEEVVQGTMELVITFPTQEARYVTIQQKGVTSEASWTISELHIFP